MNTSQNLDFYYKRLADLYRGQWLKRAVRDRDLRVSVPPPGRAPVPIRWSNGDIVPQHVHRSEFIRVVDELFENIDALSTRIRSACASANDRWTSSASSRRSLFRNYRGPAHNLTALGQGPARE